MKNFLLITLSAVVLYSCSSDDTDTSALDAQIASLQTRVDNLTAQVTAAGAEATELSNKVQNLESQLAEAIQNYNEAQIEIEDLESELEFYEAQLDEILFTIQFWFESVNGDYEFDVYSGSTFIGSYAWEIGVSEDDDLVFNSYGWSSDACYEYIPGASLGDDAETYITDASLNQFGLVSYNVDGSIYGLTGQVNVFQFFTYTSAGLTASIRAYQDGDLVYSLASTSVFQKTDIPASDFCD